MTVDPRKLLGGVVHARALRGDSGRPAVEVWLFRRPGWL
jgi:hypothetical protein